MGWMAIILLATVSTPNDRLGDHPKYKNSNIITEVGSKPKDFSNILSTGSVHKSSEFEIQKSDIAAFHNASISWAIIREEKTSPALTKYFVSTEWVPGQITCDWFMEKYNSEDAYFSALFHTHSVDQYGSDIIKSIYDSVSNSCLVEYHKRQPNPKDDSSVKKNKERDFREMKEVEFKNLQMLYVFNALFQRIDFEKEKAKEAEKERVRNRIDELSIKK